MKAYIRERDGEILQVKAHSSEIAKINNRLITTVKYLHTRKITEPPKVVTVDKGLFTSDDVFESATEQQLGNTFRLNEKELLQMLADLKGVRNKKQLEYLAGKLQARDERLRFTLHPVFGFLFFVKGEAMNHFIWELLDSHATYVWSFDREHYDRKNQYRIVEEMIQQIRDHGRQHFKRSYNRREVLFHVIRHEKIGSDFNDGFAVWRSRLDEKLV